MAGIKNKNKGVTGYQMKTFIKAKKTHTAYMCARSHIIDNQCIKTHAKTIKMVRKVIDKLEAGKYDYHGMCISDIGMSDEE
jgi:hypothetical protein